MKKYLQFSYKFNPDGSPKYPGQADGIRDEDLRKSVSGALHLTVYPLRRMAKDFIDTFKPYKGKYQLKRDYLQLVNGLKVTLGSVLLAIVYPFMLLEAAFIAIKSGFRKTFPFVRTLLLFPLEIAGNLLSGVTQIVTFPLALLRIPFRMLITHFTGVPKIENNAGIKALVKKAEKAEALNESTYLIDKVLREKIQYAVAYGQTSNIPDVQKFANGSGRFQHITYRSFLSAKTTPNTNNISADIEFTQTGESEYSKTMQL